MSNYAPESLPCHKCGEAVPVEGPMDGQFGGDVTCPGCGTLWYAQFNEDWEEGWEDENIYWTLDPP